jgi:hypothetical protein
MRKTTKKKRLQDIFSHDRNSNPKSLAYTAVINFSTLMFDRHGDIETIAVGERNRGHTFYEHSNVDSHVSPCIYTLEFSSCEEEGAQLVCCDKF